MTEVVISCAADADLAGSLHNYLLSRLHAIDKNGIVLEGDEIYVDVGSDTAVNKKRIVEAIHSFTKEEKDYESHQITEFGNMITIGITAKPGALMENLLTCEMCSYMTPYEEQLRLHKMTHGNVMIG